MTSVSGTPAAAAVSERVAIVVGRTPLNAVAFTFRTEIVMSVARSADVQISAGTVKSGTPQRGDVLERGVLIGGKSVPASSGKLADDLSPWDGEIYARVAAAVHLLRTAGVAYRGHEGHYRLGDDIRDSPGQVVTSAFD
jgi:hypothetical protein